MENITEEQSNKQIFDRNYQLHKNSTKLLTQLPHKLLSEILHKACYGYKIQEQNLIQASQNLYDLRKLIRWDQMEEKLYKPPKLLRQLNTVLQKQCNQMNFTTVVQFNNKLFVGYINLLSKFKENMEKKQKQINRVSQCIDNAKQLYFKLQNNFSQSLFSTIYTLIQQGKTEDQEDYDPEIHYNIEQYQEIQKALMEQKQIIMPYLLNNFNETRREEIIEEIQKYIISQKQNPHWSNENSQIDYNEDGGEGGEGEGGEGGEGEFGLNKKIQHVEKKDQIINPYRDQYAYQNYSESTQLLKKKNKNLYKLLNLNQQCKQKQNTVDQLIFFLKRILSFRGDPEDTIDTKDKISKFFTLPTQNCQKITMSNKYCGCYIEYLLSVNVFVDQFKSEKINKKITTTSNVQNFIDGTSKAEIPSNLFVKLSAQLSYNLRQDKKVKKDIQITGMKTTFGYLVLPKYLFKKIVSDQVKKIYQTIRTSDPEQIKKLSKSFLQQYGQFIPVKSYVGIYYLQYNVSKQQIINNTSNMNVDVKVEASMAGGQTQVNTNKALNKKTLNSDKQKCYIEQPDIIGRQKYKISIQYTSDEIQKLIDKSKLLRSLNSKYYYLCTQYKNERKQIVNLNYLDEQYQGFLKILRKLMKQFNDHASKTFESTISLPTIIETQENFAYNQQNLQAAINWRQDTNLFFFQANLKMFLMIILQLQQNQTEINNLFMYLEYDEEQKNKLKKKISENNNKYKDNITYLVKNLRIQQVYQNLKMDKKRKQNYQDLYNKYFRTKDSKGKLKQQIPQSFQEIAKIMTQDIKLLNKNDKIKKAKPDQTLILKNFQSLKSAFQSWQPINNDYKFRLSQLNKQVDDEAKYDMIENEIKLDEQVYDQMKQFEILLQKQKKMNPVNIKIINCIKQLYKKLKNKIDALKQKLEKLNNQITQKEKKNKTNQKVEEKKANQPPSQPSNQANQPPPNQPPTQPSNQPPNQSISNQIIEQLYQIDPKKKVQQEKKKQNAKFHYKILLFLEIFLDRQSIKQKSIKAIDYYPNSKKNQLYSIRFQQLQPHSDNGVRYLEGLLLAKNKQLYCRLKFNNRVGLYTLQEKDGEIELEQVQLKSRFQSKYYFLNHKQHSKYSPSQLVMTQSSEQNAVYYLVQCNEN